MAIEEIEMRELAKIFGPATGELFSEDPTEQVSVAYFVTAEDDPGAFFVTVGLAKREPLPEAERYELGIDVTGFHSPSELHAIGDAFLETAQQLAKSAIAPEQIVTIDLLEFVFPGRSQALVTDFMFRFPEYVSLDSDNLMKARLLFLRPLFHEEIRWVRTMSQVQVGELFARAEVLFEDPEREPFLVRVGPQRVP